MKIEEGMVLQPYGKDEVSMNFIVSPMGKWMFGPSDVDKIPTIKKTANIFNFVRFKCKNPKYYVNPISPEFKIRDVDHRKKWKLTHITDECKAIFFFLFYEPKENFVAMNYTTKEKEFDIIEKNMNILGTIAFYGRNFNVVEEEWDHGITIERDHLNSILDNMKNDQQQFYQ